ncbi:protein phosphatase 2C-like domain-containing protein 1 [Sorex araneus]|uniref:protein phosphatase 2C-like domain-containing protein 1 n=1 Tax=Sorex araneus TaxID=42254 RepID=UPI0024334BF5|nr:protein phosphatase 2C-like domain-containing protein 1 [Sorex araneus]
MPPRSAAGGAEWQAPRPPPGEVSILKEKKSLRNTEDQHDMADQEITVPCSKCKNEIILPNFFLHQKQHVALYTLGFEWTDRNNLEPSVVADHRQDLITKLLAVEKLNEKNLKNINNAFELLWEKQLRSNCMITDYIQRSAVQLKNVCHLLVKGVAVCNDRNTIWKASMNDRFTIVNEFGHKPDVCFLGLFDGHHGATAADLTAMELHILLLHQLAQFDPSYQMTLQEQEVINSFCTVFKKEYTCIEELFSTKERTEKRCGYTKIHSAFAKAFLRMDRLLRLGRKEESKFRWSGCSALACVLEGNIKHPSVTMNLRGNDDEHMMAENFASGKMPQVISGVLHVANTGNVEAVLCRNGKGFCLTKEHTTRNIHERKRVLEKGAVISSNEPYGLIEGQEKLTRGLGFHGHPKLKNVIIPAPQTISVPIDDLCQFLILATNGLWEVLDKKEVTALAITIFQTYEKTYSSNQAKGSLFSPNSEPYKSKSNSNIPSEFKSDSERIVSTINPGVTLSDSNLAQNIISNPENKDTLLSEVTDFENKTYQHSTPEDSSGKQKESRPQNFYKSAAEYLSHELVNAALAAGSKDNITIMVILLSGLEYQINL